MQDGICQDRLTGASGNWLLHRASETGTAQADHHQQRPVANMPSDDPWLRRHPGLVCPNRAAALAAAVGAVVALMTGGRSRRGWRR
jgi:hypothetical protein